MPELYTLELTEGKIVFVNGVEKMPDWALNPAFNPASAEAGVQLVARMGDPDQVHAAIFRKGDAPGGIFSVFFDKTLLFAAKAPTNLVFAVAMGFFGELTANARYGIDVFENMELPND